MRRIKNELAAIRPKILRSRPFVRGRSSPASDGIQTQRKTNPKSEVTHCVVKPSKPLLHHSAPFSSIDSIAKKSTSSRHYRLTTLHVGLSWVLTRLSRSGRLDFGACWSTRSISRSNPTKNACVPRLHAMQLEAAKTILGLMSGYHFVVGHTLEHSSVMLTVHSHIKIKWITSYHWQFWFVFTGAVCISYCTLDQLCKLHNAFRLKQRFSTDRHVTSMLPNHNCHCFSTTLNSSKNSVLFNLSSFPGHVP